MHIFKAMLNKKRYLFNQLILLLVGIFSHQVLFSQDNPPTVEDHPEGKGIIREIDLQFDDSGTISTVLVTVIDGKVFLDGDILIGTEAEVFSGAAILNITANVWPNSTMPYTIKAGYTTEELNMISYGINHINTNSNLCLIPRTTEEDYVEFNKDEGDVCFSAVGMSGGKQIINVSIACGVGAVIHEILHAAGHWHEQSRADRDDYVTIDLTTVPADKQHNFNKYSTGADLGPYDYESLMHYSEKAFSTDGSITIQVKTPPGTISTDIGQRLNMSAGDIAAVNQVYTANPSCAEITGLPVNLSIKDFGDISLDPATGIATVTGIVVENNGHTASPASNLAFFSSSNAVNASDFAIPALAPGASHTIGTATFDGSSLPNGNYTFGILVDNTGSIAEGSESDNYHAWTVPVLSLPLCGANAISVANVVTNPSTCGGADGAMQLLGLTNGETYTINYKKDGVVLNPPLTFTATGTTHQLSSLEQGVYTEINVTASGCTSINYERALVGPSPNPPIISLSCDPELLMTNEAPSGYTYQWYKDDVLINGATSQTYTPTGTGAYKARFLNGLCDSEDAEVFNIQDFSSIPGGISTGKSIDFDGTDDHILIDGNLIENVTDYTIELWFKMAAYPTTNTNLFDFGIDGNSHQFLSINTNSFTYVIAKWNGSGVTTHSISASTQPSLNEWHHVAITYDDNTQAGKLYLDGVEVGTATLGLKPTDYQEFAGAPYANYIGRSISFGASEYFQGQIDDFRYWTAARSLQMINDNRFCSVDCPGDLLLYLPFEDGIAGGTNTTLTETAGYSSNGEINGNLQGFGLTGTASNFVAATGIPACSITAPEINVKGLDVSIAAGDITPSVADDTDFGNIFGIYEAHTHTFTIENLGTTDLTVGTISSDKVDFEVTQAALATVAAGNSTTFTVRFYPKTLGQQTAIISIVNNDSNENPYEFTVTGNTKDYIESAQTGDWNVATTWVGGVVPAADDGAHILSGHNVSVVAAEVISVVDVKDGGTLTVTAAGTLDVNGVATQGLRNEGTTSNAGIITVNNSETYGVYNLGTFNNSGRLDIGNTSTSGAYGFFVVNSSGSLGVLNNLPNGVINIDRSTSNGMNFLGNNAIFTNEGTLNIGSISGAPAIPRGINYEYVYTCTILNKSTGDINIDNTSDAGIQIWEGIVTNEGTIDIGANVPAGDYGIISYGTIANASGAILNIDNVTRSGMYFLTGAGSNAGTINIGANASIGNQGLYTQVTYDNSGVLNIDNTPVGVSVNTGTFNNTGTVTIGEVNGVATLVGGNSSSPFSNNLEGTLKGTGIVNARGFVNNGGTVSPGYSPGIQTFNFAEDFTNSIIEIEVNGHTTAGTDFDQIVVNGAATLAGTLAVAINYIPTSSSEITILDATSLTGTFNVISPALPADWSIVYDSPNVGEVSLVYVTCDLAIGTQPTNQEVCEGDDVTFNVAASSSAGGLTYQWQKVCNIEATAWTTYDVATNSPSGFPHDNVRDIYEKDGVIYAATGGGVATLDIGNNATSWTIYNTSTVSPSGFPNNTVHGVYVSNGIIYAATEGGVATLDIGNNATSWTVYNTSTVSPSGLPHNTIREVYELNGVIYAGTYGGGVATLDIGNNATSWTVYNTSTANPSGIASNFIEDLYVSNGMIYIGTPSGVGILDIGNNATSWTVYRPSNSNFPTSIVGSIYEKDGILYAVSHNPTGHLSTLDIGNGATNWTVYNSSTANPSGFQGTPTGVYVDNGVIYVSVISGGVLTLDKGNGATSWVVHNSFTNTPSGFPSYDAWSVYAANGVIYSGTTKGVGVLFGGSTVTDITTGGTSAAYTFTPQAGDEVCTYKVVVKDANNCEVMSNAVSFTNSYASPDIAAISTQTNTCPSETVDLSNLTITDNNAVTGTVITFHSAMPISATDMSNQLGGTTISADQTVFVMIANTATGCFDVASFMVDITACNTGTCDPNDLTINDNSIPADTYHTSKSITSSGAVAASTIVIFKATQTITLQPGFHAVAGSEFSAVIEACQATLVESETAKVIDQPSTQLVKESEIVGTPSVKVFPNPTTYRASIDLTLPVAEAVQLDLFDLSGKGVANLVKNVTLPAGIHHFDWQCEQVEAGMYLIVLNGQVVSKLVVIR